MAILDDLTAKEKKLLDDAMQRHYVLSRRGRGRLVQAYGSLCSQRDEPFIREEIKGRYADFYLELPALWEFPPDIQAELRAIGERETAGIGGSWVFVGEVTCRISKFPVERAEDVAAALYRLAADSRCNSSIYLK